MTTYWATEDLPADQWTEPDPAPRITTREKRDLRRQGLNTGQLNDIRTVHVLEEYL